MGSQYLQPKTPEELLIYRAITGTWIIWLLGGLYLVGAVLGYILLAMLVLRLTGHIETRPGQLHAPPATVLLWVASMLVMALCLVLAHINFELGLAQMTKSMFGWMKGWALMAIFPLVGAMLPIRPQIIYRATSLLALQTLALAPFFYISNKIGLPSLLYVSPLKMLLGASPEFFTVSLYGMDEVTGSVRWRFFAPWSTAAAFVAGLGLILSLQERRLWWQVTGALSTLIVCYMAGSRLSIVALPAMLLGVLVLSNLTRPVTWGVLAVAGTFAVLLSYDVMVIYEDALASFNSARAASSRVRTALGNIAVHRWLGEAPIFGHGILERGGHVVELMLIGSHHTWWGLLFVKGAVGFAALAIPMIASILSLIARAQMDRSARAALGILFSMFLFSLGDTIEIIAYLFWPALVILGIALRRPFRNPLAHLGSRTESGENNPPEWASAAR